MPEAIQLSGACALPLPPAPSPARSSPLFSSLSLSAPLPPPPPPALEGSHSSSQPVCAACMCVCAPAATLYCGEHTAHVLCMDVGDTLGSLNRCKQARCPAHHMTLSILLLLAHFIGDTHHTWCNQSTEYMK